MTIATVVDGYLRHVAVERGLAANTVAAYRRDLGLYAAWLTGRPDAADVVAAAAAPTRPITDLRLVTRHHVSAFVQYLGLRPDLPLTAASIARILSTVRGFHRFLLGEGVVETDVAHDSKPPKLALRLPTAISIAQVTAFLAATDGDDVQRLRDKALLELLYATGARVSEVVELNVDDVRLEDFDSVRLTGKGD